MNIRQMIQKFRFKKSEIGVFSKGANEISQSLEKNCRIIGLTRGQFSLIDLIHTILQKVGPSNIYLCTWSAGIKDANQVKWMLDTNLIKSFTIITDHSYVTRQKRYAMELTRLFGEENIRTSEIHAKFTLIQNQDWNICIRHSMNLNANKTCESFEIDDSKEIYDFYFSFVKHILKMEDGFEPRSFVVNKSLDQFFNDTVQKTKDSTYSGWT